MKRSVLLLMGLATLLLFPLPTIAFSYFIKDESLTAIFQLNKLTSIPVFYGLELGFIYAVVASIFLQASVFQQNPLPAERIFKTIRLRLMDAVFISFCAGFGEELLFRAGIQPYVGVLITSILFVAIHGYFSIKNPVISFYGLLVTPFILLIGCGFEYFGLWFSISAHMMYDLVILMQFVKRKPNH